MGTALAVGLAISTIHAQIPGRNINMVSGSTWPDGDPFLQRQNEPSIAASTRNPLHLLAGANDYRTVDLPGLPGDETGDAWLGLFKSFDGGQRWISNLLPGYPQDELCDPTKTPNPDPAKCAIYGYAAGADAVVRAGTNGLMYYAGLAFDRSAPGSTLPGKSAIFVARFIDNNNKEAGDTFAHIGTRKLATDPGGASGNFLDKPWMAVDIPRDNTRCTITTPGEKGPITQNLPAGPVYVAYTLKSKDSKGDRYDVFFTRSADCGNTWTTPVRLNDVADRANQGATVAIDPRNGNVHVAWRRFDLVGDNDALMAVKFTVATKKVEGSKEAHKPKKDKKEKDKDKKKKIDTNLFFKKGGVSKAIAAANLAPFDQGTSNLDELLAFRTNAYPSMTVDDTGRVYLAWTERGHEPLANDPVTGEARILVSTSVDGQVWTPAQPVSIEGQLGHQLMPTITFAGGKLMLVYYDLRETRSEVFSRYVDDKTALGGTNQLRHTIDLRASMGTPGAVPVFAPSVRVSDYLMGAGDDGVRRQLQVNPPNLPMFMQGTAPFLGDYVDVTAAPAFLLDATGKWTYNSLPGAALPIFHAAWTDNRDVRPPFEDRNADGNPWNDYTPPAYTGQSPLDPTRLVPICIPGNAGSRNQNIYTARITGGILVGSPGNTKKLSPDLQRGFVVFVQNTTAEKRTFRLTITNQPPGGRASFEQFPAPPYDASSPAPLAVIDTVVPTRSTSARTVYVTSSDEHARLNITIAEVTTIGGGAVAGGLGGVIVLNPDIDNPDIDNPDIDNPDIDNPDIDNAEVMTPDIDNPDIDNPDIDNPDIDNPDIDNPDIDNVVIANPDIDNPAVLTPDIDNPDIDNPDIDNPDIDNPAIANASMTDVTWTITNRGNTTAAYNINLFFAQTSIKPELSTQLILYRTYRTPVVVNCAIKYETRKVLVASVPDPELVKSSTGEVSNPNDPEDTNATIYLEPGGSAEITLRIYDTDASDNIIVTNPDGSEVSIDPTLVPNEDVTPVVQQQGVDSEDVEDGVTEPPIVVQFPAPQTVPDSVSTAPQTPVTINVLANDSTAFGSTKVMSLHPAGMATHSGGGPGDVAYQPASGFLYTQRGAIDPNTDTLVGRFGLPPGAFGIIGHQANPRTGINYGRANAPTAPVLTALDARPGSPTFHQYLAMPGAAEGITNSVLNIALDTANHRLYVLHGTTPPGTGAVATASLSAIDIDPASATFHNVLFTAVLPGNVRGQSVAVNSRTQQVYVTGTNANGGVFVLDATVSNPPAIKIPVTSNGWGIVVNEAANLVFAASAQSSIFALYAIDGATLATTTISTSVPMRFNFPEERLALHEASGKVFMRLETSVVIIDGQRGSPTRNTVVGTVFGLGRDASADIAIDQTLGLVVTTGGFDFRADIIDVASNGLVATIPLLSGPSDVAIDQVNHRAFVSVPLTYVQEINLNTLAPTAQVAVFVESGGAIVNPVTNKAYAPFQAITSGIAKVSGAGFDGVIPGLNAEGRYNFSARHNATNRYFVLNQSNQAGESAGPGSMVVIDGATDAVLETLDTLPNPFAIGINQVTGTIYVGAINTPFGPGGIQMFDANDLSVPPVLVGGEGALPPSLNPGANPGALNFGRYVVVNPTTNTAYALQLNANASAASIVEIDPATDQMTALDGVAAAPLGNTLGRVDVVRVSASNRVYLGMFDGTTNTVRIVAMDGTSHAVLGTWVGGSHSGRHPPSYLIENNDRLYVLDFNNDIVTMLDGLNLNTTTPVVTALPDGPSATAFNVAANRLYVSSLTSKTLTALDGTTLAVLSSVRLPLVAHFLYVDEVESRLYTSGGDSSDESGIMVVTDVLGQLGTGVSVSAVGTSSEGSIQLNPDYSVTYTPAPGFMGIDQFTYTITAPTGTAIGTVSVNVVPSVPSSAAFGDAYTTPINQLLTVAAPGPMGNDATGGPATMVVTQTTTDGELTEQPDGSFTYQPDPGFTGTDTFLYHTLGPLGTSNTAAVTIAVTAALDLVVTTVADSGAGSLRQAMLTANIEPGSSIRFNISGAGPHTILPANALPTMTVPVTIDGFTQPGSSPNDAPIGTNAVMKIIVRGPSGSNGFTLRGGNSTIRGLVINGFSSNNGILLDGGPSAGLNTIEGNFIGTDATGTTAVPNQTGISSQSPDNLIGGTSLASRNLISGNSNQGARALATSSGGGGFTSIGSGTMFKNNLIGTKASGMTALPNNGGGLTMSAPDVVIGGPTAAERNVISGNGNTGISAFANVILPTGSTPAIVVSAANGLIVQGNFIGTTADGIFALGNANGGISANARATIGGGAGTTPGGACTGACNLISGNIGNGLSLGNSYDNSNPSFVGPPYASAENSVVEGNYIGVNVNGNAALGNTSVGLSVNAPDVKIGGGSPETRNVIAGNGLASNNSGISIGSSIVSGTPTVVATGERARIRGNYVGLNAAGTAAIGNGTGINVSVPDVRIGGTAAADRNVISGNVQSGINTFVTTFPSSGGSVLTMPSGLVVQGNYIGTSASGMLAIGNGNSGINATGADTIIGGGTGTTPGGDCTGACNLISGNGGGGLQLSNSYDGTTGTLYSSASESVAEGNYIGVNLNGTSALPNLGQGIQLNAPDIKVGGGTPATRNVIGGNTNNNASGINVGSSTAGSTLVASGAGAIIRSNYIGLRADGTGAIPNHNGISVSVPNVRIGGTAAADRNVISGNNQQGINSFSSVPSGMITAIAHPTGLIVQGNYIGTSPDGLTAMGNGSNGISVSGANSIIGGTTDVTVGGACTGACNLVSGNGSQAITANISFSFNTGAVYGDAAGTKITGNYVGLNVLGTETLPNNGTGISVNAPSVFVGDGTPEGRNLVAGNTNQGIGIGANHTATNVVVGTGEGSVIRGNWIGFNAAGTTAFPNGQGGIGAGAPNVTIGGPNPTDGNVALGGPFSSGISLYRSTNGSVELSAGGDSLVQNNLTGTNPAGTARMNTVGSGMSIQTANNQILNNVIAGNGIVGPPTISATGISISGSFATDNIVTGNFIGTNANGDLGLGNTGSGIYIDGSDNTIGGTNEADRNVIAASFSNGVNIGTSPSAPGTTSGNVVLGNYIGVGPDGVTPLPNNTGVSFFTSVDGTVSGNTIGGATAGHRNIISGNTNNGVSLGGGATTTGNFVIGNYIGVAFDGSTPAGNTSAGIFVNDAQDNTLSDNLIAFNQVGVALQDTSVRNQILGNRIRSNTNLGIDLGWNGVTANDNGDADTGANNRQNFPVITDASNTPTTETQVTVDLSSFANGDYTLQFFASATCDSNGYGEGELLVGTFPASVPGSSTFLLPNTPTGHVITATATDSDGNTSEFSACAIVDGTQVTNAGDSGPGSLRAAITNANTMPGTQTITFNIPNVTPASPALISAVSSLPAITQPVIIDATTQQGYDNRPVVELTSQTPLTGRGFDVQANTVTIRGLMITKFNEGIATQMGTTGHLFERNVIGTNRDNLHGLSNFYGVNVRSGGTLVQDNVIGGNSNDVMVSKGSFNTVANNIIGVGHDGITTLAPGTTGIVVFDGASDTAIDGNRIAGKNGWGVDIQNTGSQPHNTRLRNNTIGLNANGSVLANMQGGVRNDWGNGTRIGEPGGRNVISGNGGPGIWVVGNPITLPLIQNNYIGTDPAGASDRGNAFDGIFVSGSSPVQIGGAGAGEGNVISGNDQNGIMVNGALIVSPLAVIYGNIIGLDATGATAVGNSGAGIVASSSAITVGGSNPAMRNVISGNQNGIAFSNSGSTKNSMVVGNYIGTDITGMLARGNSTGVLVGSAPGTVIGGNVISGNSIGITIDNISWPVIGGLYNATVEGNIIGLNKDKNGAVPNATGIHIANNDNLIGGNTGGSPNFISGNTGIGVRVAAIGIRNRISQNEIFNNGGLGIDLDNDGVTANDNGDTDGDSDDRANDAQNFPVLSGATSSAGPVTQVNVDLSTFKVGNYTVEFFASAACDGSGHGEGGRFVGSRLILRPGAGNVTLDELVPAGQFITATATDAGGNTSEFGGCVEVDADPPTTVTNTDDSGAGSLRAAIAAANSTLGTQTISFNIPGVTATSPALIAITSGPLPAITEAVVIDATGQSGYDGLPVIELRGPSTTTGWAGLNLGSGGVTVKGLSVTRFAHGLLASEGFTGHHIAQNWIGTNRSHAAGLGNTTGIEWRASTSIIRDNVVSGNDGDGIYLQLGAGTNHILNNFVGVRAAGTATLPNGGNGIAMVNGPHDNTIDGNVISGNGGWGVDIGYFPGASQVQNTTFRGNVIGLDASGGDAGNFQGGIRLNLAPGTEIGVVGVAPNVISGNGGNLPSEIGVGIQVFGTVATMPRIRNNYIGLDQAGVVARSNNNKGIVLDGPAFIGGTRGSDGNWISGNGDASGGAGIFVGPNAGGSLILGNIIGLNVNNDPVGNGYSGITTTAAGVVYIGDPAPDRGNVISGNGVFGISILQILATDPPPANAFVEQNFIGTDASGTLARGNGQAGISVSGSGHNIGGPGPSANVIAYNGAQGGVRIFGSASGVRVHQNSIRNNAGLGIDLEGDGVTANDEGDGDSGANGLQNFPKLISAYNNAGSTKVDYDLTSFAPGSYTLHFFSQPSCHASGHGEGAAVAGTPVSLPGGTAGTFDTGVGYAPGGILTATAMDSAGNTSEFSACVTVDPPTLVSNTNDSGPGSLRAAMTAANSTPGAQNITFNIPGVSPAAPGLIAIASALPIITDSVTIDARTHPGYDGFPMIELRGVSSTAYVGFDIQANNVTIGGLSITRFHQGISSLQGTSGHNIIDNIIGTNSANAAGVGNHWGISWRSHDGSINNNVVSGNSEGIRVITGGTSNTFAFNKIGIGVDGTSPRPNGGHGVVLYDGASNNIFERNTISANAGWGVDIQHSGALAQVQNTLFRRNIIGLDANGQLIGAGAEMFEGPTSYGPYVNFGQIQRGNLAGGIHVVNAPGTMIGEGGNEGSQNTISGNTGPGVLMDVVAGGGTPSKIQNNFIGLDPTGTMARGNGANGVYSLAPGLVIGGAGAFESNVISANIANGVVAAGAGVSQAIVNNLIGTNYDGTTTMGADGNPLGNGVLTDPALGCCKAGIFLSSGNNTVYANVIGGNQIGVRSSASTSSLPNLIDWNFIGTNNLGVINLANTKGIFLAGDAAGTTVIRNNIRSSHEEAILAAEGSAGALIGGSSDNANAINANNRGIVVGYNAGASDNRIRISHNTIYDNNGLGIDLGNDGPTANDGPTMEDWDSGPNGLQNYPDITQVAIQGLDTRVEGGLESTANTQFTIHVYTSATCDASGFGEGGAYRMSFVVSTNSVGQGFYSLTFPGQLPAGHVVTMTATDELGNTSEFSNCAPLTTYSVDGFVRYSNTPLQGVTMELIDGAVTDPADYIATTNVDGNYEFPTIPPGYYWLKALGPDPSYHSYSAVQIEVTSANITENFQLLKKIQQLDPANHQINVSALPELVWTANPDAWYYTLQIRKVSTGQEVDDGPLSMTNTYRVQTVLEGSTSYSWQVEAYDAAGRQIGQTTQLFDFTVGAPVEATVLGTSGGQANENSPPSGTDPIATITLAANQQVTISATGLIQYFTGDPGTSPNGNGSPAPPGDLAPGLTSASLIGRIGNTGPWQQLGTGPIVLTAGSGGGVLYLAVNDSDYGDNSGSWTVTIQP